MGACKGEPTVQEVFGEQHFCQALLVFTVSARGQSLGEMRVSQSEVMELIKHGGEFLDQLIPIMRAGRTPSVSDSEKEICLVLHGDPQSGGPSY